MKIETLEDCFKFRLLRKIRPDIEKSKRSLEIARERLKTANTAYDIALKFKFFNFVIIEAYMAMFHAARALLYKDGIQEKSHFAMYLYLKERYSRKIPFHIINLLNIHRIERHETMYGLEYQPTKEDAEIALKDANIFVKEVEKVLKR
ncbi:MAG: HEPN domain-containing protein [Candidatus Aenigmatarchaeota archaeon]|nr:MAG: HEPN domain-containing protein [Candidatus Aenigmarchaeota archaeon]